MNMSKSAKIFLALCLACIFIITQAGIGLAAAPVKVGKNIPLIIATKTITPSITSTKKVTTKKVTTKKVTTKKVTTPSKATTSTTNSTTTSTAKSGWTLVWHDEFNGNGTAPDSSKWTHATGQINGEEYDTNSINNCFQQNGNLVIRALKENYGGCAYTSALISTRGNYSVTYGRVEARIKIPYGHGLWPGFWLEGASGKWPSCGEIDVMENIGKDAKTAWFSVHGSGGDKSGSYTSSANLSADYHVYAVEWDATQVKWYVDNTCYYTMTKAQLQSIAGGNSAFDKPYNILLDLFVGGDWGGSPDSTTVLPANMYIDYLRVYKKN